MVGIGNDLIELATEVGLESTQLGLAFVTHGAGQCAAFLLAPPLFRDCAGVPVLTLALLGVAHLTSVATLYL